MFGVFSSLCSIQLSTAANIAIASFGVDGSTTGVTGFIGALNGFVWMELDFSGVDWTALPENCSADGLGWHIHGDWTYGADVVDRMGADCARTFTGNHYDPWFACGPASDNADCVNNGGCIPPSTIYDEIDANPDGDYICSPANYSQVAYTCEVGDWSGKYGNMILDESMQVSRLDNITVGELVVGSYWEPSMPVLWGTTSYGGPAQYSVVIHCTTPGKPRAFCAPITRLQAPFQTIDLTDDQTIETFFDDAGTDFEGFGIKWKQVGGVPQIEITTTTASQSRCSSWAPYLYADWPYEADGFVDVTAKQNCDLSALGGIYDPTHSCITNSSSAYCENQVRCPGNTSTPAAYTCDPDYEHFTCAVGDMYGRVGAVSNAGGTVNDPLSPPLWSLGDKAIVFVCLDTPDVRTVDNICALTVQTNGTVVFNTPAPTDGVAIFDVQLAFISSVVSAVLCLYIL